MCKMHAIFPKLSHSGSMYFVKWILILVILIVRTSTVQVQGGHPTELSDGTTVPKGTGI